MGNIKEWNVGGTFCGKWSLVPTGVFVSSNGSICQWQMEYLLVATGHPVKRCLLQSNNLPKSIPELSLQNWRIFLAPQIENIQKRLTC